MPSTDLAERSQPHQELERPATGPGRELGQKRKAQLRLALGYRDESRRGAPVKTEYFVPNGSDLAVAKFRDVYGDKPRAVDIRLPASLGGFMEIRHIAFAGGQNDGGGILKAIGSRNFALEGTLGGPDKLTVFSLVETGETDRHDNPVKQLQTEEIYIDDVDDPQAAALGVYLQATVTFGIPDVLGFGGICELHSRGKETIDTLWSNAVDIYGTLGARASLLLRPKLVLKESSMLTPRGQKAQLYVVDLYAPESIDEILERGRELRELMPAGPAAAMYGVREISEASPVVLPPTGDGVDASTVDHGRDAGHAAPPEAAATIPAVSPHLPGPATGTDGISPEEPGPASPVVDADAQALADEAAKYKPGSQKWPGLTLGEIFNHGADGREWVKWCCSNAKRPEFVKAVRDFAAVYMPEAYHEALAAQELQS